MKRATRILKRIILSFFFLVLLFLLGLSIKYSPVYVYRLITMNVADVYDYQHFENRTIKGTENLMQFAIDPDKQYVESLFSDRIAKSGFEYMPSRLIARAIDYARFGQLLLKEGEYQGKSIVSREWVLESTRENTAIPKENYPEWWQDDCKRMYYNFQFWGHANCDSTFQFAASGNLGQTIYVIPDKEIVIVHCGNSLKHYGDFDLWQIADNIRNR